MDFPKETAKKIYPTAEELGKINLVVHCPEEGCSNVFASESNLTLHLAKTHKKEHLLKTDNVPKEYYCPEHNCTYNVTKFFKSLKLLKQHFLKVHSEKSFSCETCDMKFSTQAAKNSHTEYCGVKFTCCECPSSYPCYESLTTHGRRKKHKILEKLFYKSKDLAAGPILVKSSSITNLPNTESKQECFILPKGSTSLQLLNTFPLKLQNSVTFEKGSQTDICAEITKKTKRTQIEKKLHNLHNSRETQTLTNKKPRLAAETQTIGDYVSKGFDLSDVLNSSDENLYRKSIKTQTKAVDSTTKSCNTSFKIDDFEFNYESSVQQNSSGTQTVTNIPSELFYSISTATHDSTHTDTADLSFEFMHSSSQTSFKDEIDLFNSENFFNCNSETQTDFMSVLNTDYCSNICTQTCDDILLSNLEFNNIHTQTILDDMLKSVESQTVMSSHGLKNLFTCYDMANMETQTDIEYKQMLEEINA